MEENQNQSILKLGDVTGIQQPDKESRYLRVLSLAKMISITFGGMSAMQIFPNILLFHL